MDQIIYLFSGIRFLDIADILFNSYILFRLYVLFRGTNVIRVLFAIFVLWIFGQIALALGLIITNWAMQGVIPVAALIVIIVFRNEISGVIQMKDLKSFLWGIPRYQFNTPLNMIVDSAFDMARKKIGALIVLPLKQGLDSVVQGGIPIQGKLSKEMLVSIFWPDNPLHDGAAVIHGDRITRVGTILPLSKRTDLPSLFGTRHRAAIGLTEQTDALVIVVSEESRKITLFKDKESYDIDDRVLLEGLLQEHAGDDSSKKGLKQQTFELVTASVISFLCIAGIWFSFSKGMETLAEHDVPLEFINPAQKMEIISTSSSSVKLLISGARSLINTIKPEQIKIKLNLSESLVGVNKLSITKENIILPPGIGLKKIEPAELEITLDTLVTKKLPIQPHWTGKLPVGLYMKETTALPDSVEVIGGGLVLKNISTLFTEQIPLEKLTESGTLTVGLVLSPASLKLDSNTKFQIRYVISNRIPQ